MNTGRPANSDDNHIYNSSYLDLSIYPKYEFGFGKSYTSFGYSQLMLSKHKIKKQEELEVSMWIKNSGNYDGEEIVQLYIRDKVASVSRPVLELKDFQKVFLKKGESKMLKFKIDKEKLSFFNSDLKWVTEPGEFEIMMGASSKDIRLKDNFELMD